MSNELIVPEIIKVPPIPKEWDYNNSVKAVKVYFYKWKDLTLGITNQLYIAREKLSSHYHRDGTKVPTWSQYCKDIGSSRQVVNRWLGKWFDEPKTIASKPPPIIPENQYNVITIDPPWAYGTEYDSDTRRVASPYPELPFEELMKIKIPSADDAVMWLWTTHKFIRKAFSLLELWGFEYKITMVWDKEKMGMGSWLRCQAEFCLLGIKGHPEWNLTNQRDIIRVPRRQHSRKPEEFYGMVERICEGRKRLDIFGRQKRKGWEVIGDESSKF